MISSHGGSNPLICSSYRDIVGNSQQRGPTARDRSDLTVLELHHGGKTMRFDSVLFKVDDATIQNGIEGAGHLSIAE